MKKDMKTIIPSPVIPLHWGIVCISTKLSAVVVGLLETTILLLYTMLQRQRLPMIAFGD